MKRQTGVMTWSRGVAGGVAAVAAVAGMAAAVGVAAAQAQGGTAEAAGERHNVIVFVADGLRRGSVTAEGMPTFARLRREGVDFQNSHAVYPTLTTVNAAAIATGHVPGDTGDYSNNVYPGVWLTRPDGTSTAGTIAPFLENDEILADMNAVYGGNYLGERPLLSAAREKGYNVASVGKLGPTAIQQADALHWTDYGVSAGEAIVVDDSTGQANGVMLPTEMLEAMDKAGLAVDAPTRSNGYGESSQGNNGFVGDAVTPGTRAANRVQQQWFAEVATEVLLPRFAAESKPFVLLFWSRDPDGTQHNQGDSLQNLGPGINGATSTASLRNADHDLKELLDWLDAHPAVKAKTDVLVTSDHGFATISRREIGGEGKMTGEPSAALTYDATGKEKPEPPGTLPTGFLAVDLAIREHLRLFDPAVRAVSGSSPYQELMVGGERSQHPSTGSALLGENVQKLDGSDARVIVEASGATDLLYVPSGDAATVHETLATLASLDYVGALFVDDRFCTTPAECPGALPMSAVGLTGTSRVTRPAIAVSFKVFYPHPGELESAAQISDTTLQEGQGMHGGLGREQTWNNMAAMGPDFKRGFVDAEPVGNLDVAPTLAHLLGVELPEGAGRGRVLREALAGAEGAASAKKGVAKTLVSAPAEDGRTTVLEFQELDGARYVDKGCLVEKGAAKQCP